MAGLVRSPDENCMSIKDARQMPTSYMRTTNLILSIANEPSNKPHKNDYDYDESYQEETPEESCQRQGLEAMSYHPCSRIRGS